MSSSRYRAVALAGVFGISFAGILFRFIELDTATTAFFRAAYAIPFLALLWWWKRSQDHRPLRSRLMAVVAGIFLGLDLLAWHVSIEHIGVGLATVLVNTQVLFVGAFAWFRYRERPTTTSVAVVPVVLVGVLLLSGLGGRDAYGTDPTLGILFGVLGGLFYGLFLLILRESNRGYLAPAQGPLLDATVGMAVVALGIGWVFVDDFTLAITWPEHGWLVVLALSAQVIGWLLIVAALPRLAALETSVIILAQPILASIWAMILFDERFSLAQWVGVLLVLGGLLIINARGAAESELSPVERVA
jgi:drug/metabolite transporter (DMT)-like permease